MLKKAFTEIWSQYKKLPYIVYKKQYLIPQKPAIIKGNNIIGKNGNILGSFEKDLPQLVNEELIAKAGDFSQHPSLIELYQKQITKKKSQRKMEIQEYKEKYMQVFGKTRFYPHILYFRENRDKIMSQLKAKKQRYSIGIVHQMYQSLPEQVKQTYIKKGRQELDKIVERRKKWEQAYKIPEVKSVRPYILYSIENGIKVTVPQFNQLDQEIRLAFRKKAEDQKRERELKLINFIRNRGLSLEQFNEIKRISLEMQKQKRLLYQSIKKKKERKFNQEQDEEQQQEEMEDENQEDEKEVEKKVQQNQRITSERMKVGLEEAHRKQWEKNEKWKEEQDEETKQVDDVSKQNNIDFEEKELDVFELKKLAQLRKKQKPTI